MAHALSFVVPGDINTRTGGYGYDRRIVAGLRQRGWTVDLVSLPGTFPTPGDDGLAAARHAFDAIRPRTVVLVDGLALGALPAIAARQRDRLRLIGLVHHPLGLETGLDAATSARLLASEREALRHVRHVVVTSTRTVDAVAHLGVPAHHITVVVPGTDPAPAAHGSRTEVPHLLCVASLTPRKGHTVLFDALEKLLHLPWHLTCVGSAHGDGDYADALRTRAATEPLASRITMAGELAGDPLDRAYDNADLFVLPTYYEGYGMVIGEAIARALPVVSTPTGAIADLVGDDAGVLVQAGDAAALAGALERLLTDAAELARLRAGAARRRPTLPTWDDACRQMEAVLVQAAGR